MQNVAQGSRPHPVITQDQNNTTLWIGHLQSDPDNHYAGQTFTCPYNGMLDNIQLFSEAVHLPGQLDLTLHEFDTNSKTFGPSLSQSSLNVDKNDKAKWISFTMPAIALKEGTTYGFRLQSPHGLIGIGEAAAGTQHPFTGHEWNGDTSNQSGRFYSYFSLAFRVEICA